MGFKKLRGVKLPEEKQGFIRYTCLTLSEQPKWIQEKVKYTCDMVGVLQTKVNRKNEKSPAKFTRPKMGITKQAGEKSHRQPG